MLSVYRVRVATEKFQFFETEDAAFFEGAWLKIHGEDVASEWSSPEVYILKPKKKEGHFVGFLGGRVFAIAQQTIDTFPLLQSFFEQSGELLPISHDGRQFWVFNCTNCLNALDKSKSDKGTASSFLAKYAFFPSRFHFTLFCIPETHELLCVEGTSAPADEFKGYVEANKLTGLMFEKLWSEEQRKSGTKSKK